MAYFEHDGCNLHYEEYGHGTPLLLVHGLGSSTLDWEMQIPALAARYRVIVPDIRGHGRSDKPRERYSIAGFSADASGKVVANWPIPGGGSPDMGNVSADGKTLWLSGRFDDVVYAFDTTTGAVKQIKVGAEPHGLTVWPMPGRYSLGHTGILR